MTYGKIIPGLKINGEDAPYPVLNERAIRAGAGLMFVIGFATMMLVLAGGYRWTIRYTLPLFFLDFILKVINPSWSYFNQIGNLLVKNQKPEYVGAIQKRFAWAIGLILSSTMMLIIFVIGVGGIIPMTVPIAICATCLFFMWLESSVGLCVGCKIYYFLVNKKLIKQPEYRPACPGGVCSINKK